MASQVLVALISGPIGGAAVAAVGWFRGRRGEDAQADKTIGEAWQEIVSELRKDISDLRDRVDALEDELRREQARSKGLEAEVDRYRSIARSLLRHVLRLRDALGSSGAEVPALPQDVEDALTSLDLP